MLYLGHILGNGQVAAPTDRVTAMAEFRQPVTKKGLLSFLGGISYYRRFLRYRGTHTIAYQQYNMLREMSWCVLLHVVADDCGLEYAGFMLYVEECVNNNESEILEMLSSFEHVMTDKPGMTDVVKLTIHLEEGTKVISQGPYRLPDRLKNEVRKKLDYLLSAGIIEASHSA